MRGFWLGIAAFAIVSFALVAAYDQAVVISGDDVPPAAARRAGAIIDKSTGDVLTGGLPVFHGGTSSALTYPILSGTVTTMSTTAAMPGMCLQNNGYDGAQFRVCTTSTLPSVTATILGKAE